MKIELTKEQLEKLDEDTRKAILEGRVCPLKIELDLSSQNPSKITK